MRSRKQGGGGERSGWWGTEWGRGGDRHWAEWRGWGVGVTWYAGRCLAPARQSSTCRRPPPTGNDVSPSPPKAGGAPPQLPVTAAAVAGRPGPPPAVHPGATRRPPRRRRPRRPRAGGWSGGLPHLCLLARPVAVPGRLAGAAPPGAAAGAATGSAWVRRRRGADRVSGEAGIDNGHPGAQGGVIDNGEGLGQALGGHHPLKLGALTHGAGAEEGLA